MKKLALLLVIIALFGFSLPVQAEEPAQVGYTVGVDDVMDINILQPEALGTTVTVAPDGSVSFPYIGNVQVKGMTLGEIQNEVQTRLADGYMKYPVVSVSLRESRSRKFFVYGEVNRPGTYPIEESATVLKAISMAGGFTKFGSSSRVKVLRPKKGEAGYETIKININDVMNGNSDADIAIQPEDIIVVSEGMF
ncbi:MAG: polysaccharide export protein [Candidatus Omnitrophica bacterium]|nr:polysaccharide export protein [Candidatus Omnitrophota bacterium]